MKTEFESNEKVWKQIRDLLKEGYDFEEASKIALRSMNRVQLSFKKENEICD